MNTGALAIIGVGAFITIGGFAIEEKIWILVGAIILLSGFGLLGVKSTNKNPSTGKEYMRCPNCGKYSGEEIQKEKERQESGKLYKCMLCGYKW